MKDPAPAAVANQRGRRWQPLAVLCASTRESEARKERCSGIDFSESGGFGMPKMYNTPHLFNPTCPPCLLRALFVVFLFGLTHNGICNCLLTTKLAYTGRRSERLDLAQCVGRAGERAWRYFVCFLVECNTRSKPHGKRWYIRSTRFVDLLLATCGTTSASTRVVLYFCRAYYLACRGCLHDNCYICIATPLLQV